MVAGANEVHPDDGWPIVFFATERAFETWLDTHHADPAGCWIKFAKKGRGITSITLPEAKEVSMCFGWVDSKMQKSDDDHYVLRYQPRKPDSTWSARNQKLAERLIADGQMRPSGLAHVDGAKADGRWDGP